MTAPTTTAKTWFGRLAGMVSGAPKAARTELSRKRRVCLGFDTLERREVLSGSGLAPGFAPSLTPLAPESAAASPAPIAIVQPGPAPVVVSLAPTTATSPTAVLAPAATPQTLAGQLAGQQQAPSVMAASANPRTVASVVTIRNLTPYRVVYTLQWPGQASQQFALPAGKARLHAVPIANAAPQILFDQSYKAGFQGRQFRLPSKPFVVGGDEAWAPRYASDGMIYDFRMNQPRTGLVVTANFGLDLNRYQGERARLLTQQTRTDFPRLGHKFEILGPATGHVNFGDLDAYNCIAWSLGIVNQWVWLNQSKGHPFHVYQAWDKLYASAGYSVVPGMDFSFKPGYQKVVLYGHNTGGGLVDITHAALQLSDGSWSSKLGGDPLIRHANPDDVAGGLYGNPLRVYIRPV
jgi:hypothetical protein